MANPDFWRQLTVEFRRLGNCGLRADGDYILGSNRTWTWRIAGATPRILSEFEPLARRAGRAVDSMTDDGLATWLEALRKGRTGFEFGQEEWEVNDDGKQGAGHLGGWISVLAETSADFCSTQECLAIEAVRPNDHEKYDPTGLIHSKLKATDASGGSRHWKPDYARHDFSSREAEACFNRIAQRPTERTALLCESAQRIFDHWARSRVELVKTENDLRPFSEQLWLWQWEWLAPLMNTERMNADDTESVRMTLQARMQHWKREAIEKAVGFTSTLESDRNSSADRGAPTDEIVGSPSVSFQRKRGPKKDVDNAVRVAGIVEKIGPNGVWRSKLDEVCEALDRERIPFPTTWKKYEGWIDYPKKSDAVKAIEYRLKLAGISKVGSKQTLG